MQHATDVEIYLYVYLQLTSSHVVGLVLHTDKCTLQSSPTGCRGYRYHFKSERSKSIYWGPPDARIRTG